MSVNQRVLCSFYCKLLASVSYSNHVFYFEISQDETTLIWLSSGREKSIKLASVSRIIPGQRTVSTPPPFSDTQHHEFCP